jgi:hypothetical protein
MKTFFDFVQFFSWDQGVEKIEFSKSSPNWLIFGNRGVFDMENLNLIEFFDFDNWKVPLRRVYSLKSFYNENRLNQCQKNFVMPRKLAQSISRLEKPIYIRFSGQNSNFSSFSPQTPILFPESWPGNYFRGSAMRTIDSPP